MIDISQFKPAATGAQSDPGVALSDFEVLLISSLVLVQNKKTGKRYFWHPSRFAEGVVEFHDHYIADADFGKLCTTKEARKLTTDELKAALATLKRKANEARHAAVTTVLESRDTIGRAVSLIETAVLGEVVVASASVAAALTAIRTALAALDVGAIAGAAVKGVLTE